MAETRNMNEALFSQLLDLAAELVACGADINLVEASLERLGAAYGMARIDAFVLTSTMVVTMRDARGRSFSQSRRIHTAMANNFDKLERLNALCTRCCVERLSSEQINHELTEIRDRRINRPAFYLGGVLAAGAFAAFFGGSVLDALVAALFALFICFLIEHAKPYCPNEVVFNFIASLLSGVGICICARLFPALHGDMIIIGGIMLLIPGIALTNSMRDMLAGDTGSGALRFLEALMWAGALALGFMVANLVTGANVDTGGDPIPIVQLAMALPASLGFALLFNLRVRLLAGVSIGGFLTWAVYLLCGLWFSDVFMPCLIASVFAAAYTQVLARVTKAPIAIFYIICEIPLIPGRGLYYTMSSAVQGNWGSMQSYGLVTIEFVLAIAFGIGIAWAARELVRRFASRRSPRS